MIRNYLVESDLKGLIPNLDNLLFTGQDDWTQQKRDAEIDVMNDFINSKFRAVYARNDLSLRTSGDVLNASDFTESVEDVITRQRWVINTISCTGSPILTLQGRNSEDDTWTDISSVTITATDETTQIISKFYNFYRISATISSATIDYESSLTETIYDQLFLFKWAEKIYWTLFTNSESEFKLKYEMMQSMYSSAWNKALIYYDTNTDGTVDVDNVMSMRSFQMIK